MTRTQAPHRPAPDIRAPQAVPVRASTSIITTFEPAPVFADLVKVEGIRRGADHIRQFTILGGSVNLNYSPVDPCGRRRADQGR